MTPESIRDLKEAVNLSEVVQNYGLNLDYRGFCSCPFHDDRTPSFWVQKDRWICFGCGEHGDAIDFVIKMEGCSFSEAFDRLGGIREEVDDDQIRTIRLQREESKKKREALEEEYRRQAALFRCIRSTLSSLKVTDDSTAQAYALLSAFREQVEAKCYAISGELRRC